ncbi:hypothetical protein EAI_04121, partial [Harpegnathos saltator]
TTSRFIHAVINAINLRLLRKWIKFLITEEDRQQAHTIFAVAAQPFDGAIGAIDCTFINILAPREHKEAFINHRGNHSLNVQAVSTNAYPIRRAMKFHYNRGERRTWIIGESYWP